MAETTTISWCDSTWNPVKGVGDNRWMCRKISPGCDHCYASTLNRRFGGIAYPRVGPIDVAVAPDEWRLDLPTLLKPLSWKKPRMIFVCSMTDVAGEWVPDSWLDAIFGVMGMAPQHTFQVLTKRPARLKRWYDRPITWREAVPTWPGLPDGVREWIDLHKRNALVDWPLPNVWVGVSVEDDRSCWRAETLKQIPARIRFISAEPLLGALPRLVLEARADTPGIDWLIVGGESGGHEDRRLVVRCPGTRDHADCPHCHGTGWTPRPLALDVVRDLRDRAAEAGTLFHFKQWGGPKHDSGGRAIGRKEYLAIPEPQRRLA